MVGGLLSLFFGLCYNDAAVKRPVTRQLYDLMQNLDYKVLDLRFVIRGPLDKDKINKKLVLLDYDNEAEEWAPFPPDRTYYSEIITALADDKARTKATFFDIFFFDPAGEQLNPDMAEVFYNTFLNLSKEADRDLQLSGALKEKMFEAYEKLASGASPSEAARMGRMLQEIGSDKTLGEVIAFMNKTGEFLMNNSGMEELTPDRDIVLSNSITQAGNVYLAQIVNNREISPYTVEDIIYNPTVHEAFAKLVMMSDRTKTKNRLEVDVNYALRNLQPEDFKQILDTTKLDTTDSGKPVPFTTEERQAIASESLRIQYEIEESLKVNEKFAFPVSEKGALTPEEIPKHYRELISMKATMNMIANGVAGGGYVKPEFQKYDGTIRTAAPASFFRGALYPHIDLMLAMVYFNIGKNDVAFYKDRIVLKNCQADGEKEKKTVVIPLFKKGTMLINWSGKYYEPGHFEHRSFRVVYDNARRYNVIRKVETGKQLNAAEQRLYDSLTQKVIASTKKEIEFFKGKITLTGLTAEGTHDLNPVPFHPRYPLVGMHANMINTISNDLFIHTVPYPILLALLIGVGLALGFVGGSAKQLPGAIVTLSTIVAAAVIGQILFSTINLWVPFVPLLIAFVAIYLVIVLYRFMTEGQEAIRMKKMFSSYVNEEVVETLIRNPEMLKLGGERMDASAMFALAGGPGLETDNAEELVDRLNEHFDVMTEQIFKYKGTLDKYEGRIIMAIFGAPVPYEDHPTKICLACADMRKAFEGMKKKWKEEGKEPLTLTVGVNSGPMIAGNMGSASRFNYTVMGDTVNVSARILGASIQYGVSFMISENTYDRAREDVIARLIDKIIVVGKEEAVRVYEIVAAKNDVLPPDIKTLLESYEKGFSLYQDRRWDEAIAQFEIAISAAPDDKPSKMLRDRCVQYKDAPPKEGWKGEYVLTSKGL